MISELFSGCYMKFEVNGEWIETSFYFWILVIFITIFTVWYWGLIAFIIAMLLGMLFGHPSGLLMDVIFIGSALFGLIFGFIISFGITLALARYVFKIGEKINDGY